MPTVHNYWTDPAVDEARKQIEQIEATLRAFRDAAAKMAQLRVDLGDVSAILEAVAKAHRREVEALEAQVQAAHKARADAEAAFSDDKKWRRHYEIENARLSTELRKLKDATAVLRGE